MRLSTRVGFKRLSLCLAVLGLASCQAFDAPKPPLMDDNFVAGCESLKGKIISAKQIGLLSGDALIDSASFLQASTLSVAERAPTPAAAINPALPRHCKILGRISPIDKAAPDIHFQINLPLLWNGRSVQYGGGGFNGVLISGTGLVPAALYDQAAPLAQGYVTYGTDSGHQNKPNVPVQAFAMNEEALINFTHASYKKVRDVAVEVMKLAYGKGPRFLYFVGSSEGGREGMVMAQRFPKDFNGIFSRVPVLHWTGLQHAGLRDGKALMGDGWINPAQVKLVHDAVLAACDAEDGLADSIIARPLACRAKFKIESLSCAQKPGPNCLNDKQVAAVKTLNSDLDMGMDLANGLRVYPGRGPSGENVASAGPTGGWISWWTGRSAPTMPPKPDNAIAWVYGGGAIQYFYARNPNADLMKYDPRDHMPRIREISALMDATNPDLTAFMENGGKLIMLENMADYAQSPYAGIQYFESVQKRMSGEVVSQFAKLFVAPNVDHVGTGGPSQVDMLGALSRWVEKAEAPEELQLIEQEAKPPFAVRRSRPLCQWPAWPQYQKGDENKAESFMCVRD